MSSIKSLVRSEVPDRISQFDNSISVQHDIHPEMNLDYNSILLVNGKTGNGKTFNIGNELATLKYLDHDFVQILYVMNNPNDLTLMKLKDLIEVPIRFISYEESGDCIQELRQYKLTTRSLKRAFPNNLPMNVDKTSYSFSISRIL